jgi:hypothetical protein
VIFGVENSRGVGGVQTPGFKDLYGWSAGFRVCRFLYSCARQSLRALSDWPWRNW